MYYKLIRLWNGTKTVSFVAGSDYRPGWRTNAFLPGRILTLPASKWEMQASIRERLAACYTSPMRFQERHLGSDYMIVYYPNRHLRKRGYRMVDAVVEKMKWEG